MSNNTHHFHFTLGPVQGFVAQARRTRDFWAGSFILSWLSAVAVKAVHAQYPGKKLEEVILFPAPDNKFMLWLEGKGADKETMPTQGSIPNRFKAAVSEETFKPEDVVNAVKEAWIALGDLVWKEDLKDSKAPNLGKAKTIWDRQLKDFWEISWVMTSVSNEDSAAIDKRKNWRTYVAPNEPGVKCAMMDGWQELSGEESPNRADMNKFWKPIRDNGRYGMKSDLRKDEALCAMAFVKRRFARHFEHVDHDMEQGWKLKGWKVPTAVPSVTYMAAVHWLKQALEKADANALADFHDKAHALDPHYGEWDSSSNIKCLHEAWGNREWKALDGNVFYSNLLENENLYPDQKKAKDVQDALKRVNNSAKIDPVSPFYAILLMDGDSLGSHMSNTNLHYSITQGLADFTKGVPDIVKDNNGFLVYAGGDDVLAILPLEDAIPCAAKLRAHYLQCFEAKPNTNPEKDRKYIPTTLSGAIEFTHINMPLTSVLKDAHKLLEDVAKEGSGRDALAIRVWKRGGLQLEWSQPWEIALIPETSNTYLENLVVSFQDVNKADEQFSNKFFYKIRERFDLLNPDTTKGQVSVLNEGDALSLMAMEYLNSGKSDLKEIKNAKERMNKATDRLRPLLKQCRPVVRKKEIGQGKENKTEQWVYESQSNIEADGALLVRFLAQKGVER